MNHSFIEVIQLIKHVRNNTVRSINAELINLYWMLGEFISERIKKNTWGSKTVEELATYIKLNQPELKGFDKRGLYRMKQFFETYHNCLFVEIDQPKAQLTNNQNNEIVPSLMTQLRLGEIKNSLLTKISWTHHLTLISRTNSAEELEFYLRLCIKENYSVRELDRQINSSTFERVLIGNSSLNKSFKNTHPKINNIVKDSYIFEFLNLSHSHTEKELKKELIKQMKSFILELGKDFLFVSQEYKLAVGNSDFYIDLLFFHRGLQCLVAFEFKNDKFKPEHLGQLNFYLEALDRDVRNTNENPSIGILICKDKDIEVVEYALNRSLSPTLITEYKTQLPDKKFLQDKLNKIFLNE